MDTFLLPGGPPWLTVELNSWHPDPTPARTKVKWEDGKGRGPKPRGWLHDPDPQFWNDAWPWNPFGPEGDGFKQGDYVIVQGTLWQDSPHLSGGPNDRNKMWDDTYPQHGGWVEIHPVDWIGRIRPAPSKRRCATIIESIAMPGQTDWVEKFDVSPRPMLGDPPPWHVVAWREITDPRFTRFDTIVPGSRTIEHVPGDPMLSDTVADHL